MSDREATEGRTTRTVTEEGSNEKKTKKVSLGEDPGFEALKDKNAYYWQDLIGLRVINQQNIELGVVTKILETGANDVLVVTSEEEAETGNKERLIPWTLQQAIIAVDLEQGVLEVDWDPDF